MKKSLLNAVLFCSMVTGYAQQPVAVDTLFTTKNQKIPCKIYEINDFEIRYRMANALEGPVFVIDKSTVRKYSLSNGYTELMVPDELSLEHEHKEIIGNREVIKISPFGIAFNHISISYEKVIKVGMNLDCEAGFINSTLNGGDFSNSGINPNNFHVGGYIKPGVKFFLGQDFSVKGLKYAHPLKGRYIKLDLGFSYLNFQGVQTTLYPQWSSQYPPSPVTTTVISTDINAFAYGGFVNYGRQFILGNILTLDYYVGAGFTGQSLGYTNPNYLPALRSNYGYYGNGWYDQSITNYYGFVRIPGLGLSFTAGFRIGYIIPSKKTYGVRKDAFGAKN